MFPAGANRTVSHLYRNGTQIIKFFLDLSKEEQRKRFLERIDEPDKNWKFSLGDIMKVYETCVSATSTKVAPWYVVPADDKENARLIISEIILDVFNGLKMAYPKGRRETPAGTAFDTPEACEVKTYRDKSRLDSKMLGARGLGGV